MVSGALCASSERLARPPLCALGAAGLLLAAVEGGVRVGAAPGVLGLCSGGLAPRGGLLSVWRVVWCGSVWGRGGVAACGVRGLVVWRGCLSPGDL